VVGQTTVREMLHDCYMLAMEYSQHLSSHSFSNYIVEQEGLILFYTKRYRELENLVLEI
jgi:hypothetical protein